MARTAITVQEIDIDGLSPVFSASVADGEKFLNSGDQFLHVKNGGGSPITVTIQTPAQIESIDIAEVEVTIPASEERIIGNFSPSIFNQSDGMVYVDYSAVTSVTSALFKIA